MKYTHRLFLCVWIWLLCIKNDYVRLFFLNILWRFGFCFNRLWWCNRWFDYCLLSHHCYTKNHPIWYFWNLDRSWNVHNFSPLAKISPFCFFILSYIVLLWCHSCDVGYITKNSICKVFQNIIIKTLAILVVLWQNVLRFKQFLSSRGLGHCPLKAVTRVRISLGTPNFIKNQNNYLYNHFNSDIITNKAGGLCPEDESPL